MKPEAVLLAQCIVNVLHIHQVLCYYSNAESAGVSHGDVIFFLCPACHLEAVALHLVSEQLVLSLSSLNGIKHTEFRIWIAQD